MAFGGFSEFSCGSEWLAVAFCGSLSFFRVARKWLSVARQWFGVVRQWLSVTRSGSTVAFSDSEWLDSRFLKNVMSFSGGVMGATMVLLMRQSTKPLSHPPQTPHKNALTDYVNEVFLSYWRRLLLSTECNRGVKLTCLAAV